MFINIVTPCSRPENLKIISESINFPRENYRWIVVFDKLEVPEIDIPENCEYYCHKNSLSVYGNAQRNFALDLIKDGFVYFNDDDTTIHPELWESIKNLDDYDFISFDQLWNVPEIFPIRLRGDIVKVNHVDSHNYLTHVRNIQNSRFITYLYIADGFFAEECYDKSISKIYIKKGLSIYNTLDKTRSIIPV